MNSRNHSPFLTINIRDCVMKIQETATFCQTWHILLYRTCYTLPHRNIAAQLSGIILWISTAEQANRIYSPVTYYPLSEKKGHQLHAKALQYIQIVLIIEAKGVVPCYCDSDYRLSLLQDTTPIIRNFRFQCRGHSFANPSRHSISSVSASTSAIRSTFC